MGTMNLKPNEIELRGRWDLGGGRELGDATCLRIEWLVQNALVRVADSDDGWETLFLDPADGRHWRRTYPEGEGQGGGPPMLVLASLEEFQREMAR